ncbi:gamma-butyrobetaine hydroxylase-like domain-containing protein [Rhizobium sp. SG2393]|uniref:gamma-butyrobetaine hydroxylase-like domain-containing protein n=1 Tax=Rhizobium sp. SG2393 TaxID=3276279 RepID=UPI00366CEC7F
MTNQTRPTELRVSRDRRTLTVSFADGAQFALPAEMMRVLSPSAEVQGHGPGQKVTVPGKRNVAILTVTPTGNYAVRIGFDDMHDSGIFTWAYLRTLGETGADLFAAYEQELADKGMSRDHAERPR